MVLLSAPVKVLLNSVAVRSKNPYGREADQRAEIIRYVATVQPLLRRGATIELDARLSPAELADIIKGLVAAAPVGITADLHPRTTACVRAPPADALDTNVSGGPWIEASCRAVR